METTQDYLICDAAIPLISTSLADELLLYHIAGNDIMPVIRSFNELSGKQIDEDFDLSQLSGGQKVLLMLCLALASPAEALCFKDLAHYLDDKRWAMVQSMLKRSNKVIYYRDGRC